MKRPVLSGLLVGWFAFAPGLAGATDDAIVLAIGQQEYLAKCAACHGESGRGEGPRAESLPQMPPDLTTYARRHGGTFPTQTAHTTIDGRGYYDVYRPMPAWGQFYAIESFSTPASATPERYVDDRIGALVVYVVTLQAR